MKKYKNSAQSSLVPALTVVCVIAAAGIVISSIFGTRIENHDTSPGTDETSDVTVRVTEPPTSPTETETHVTEPGTEPETEPETDAPPVQTIPVSIYKSSGKRRIRIDEFESVWPESDDDALWRRDTWTYSDRVNLIYDIGYFAVFTSDEEEIDATHMDTAWLSRWEENGLDNSAKVGFEFNIVRRDGETVRFTVLSPSDTFREEEYFELYLYDGVAHANDSWYSHITEATNYEDTHNVSIKITLRHGCYEIDYIELTAFVYRSEDEFDADGFYRGANKSSIVVKRAE